MDDEIEELLNQIDEYKGVVTPEKFGKIVIDEEAKKRIDAMENGWKKLYNKANSQELRWKIRNIALERADSFDAYIAFITSEGKAFAVGALFHAKTFAQRKKVATSTKFFEICVNAFELAFDLIESSEQAAEMISSLCAIKAFTFNEYNAPYERLTIKTIKKGVAISKNLHGAANIYEQAQKQLSHSTSRYDHTITWLIAEGLAASTIEFRDKKLLKEQVERCRICTRREQEKKYDMLSPLLISILEFGKYQRIKKLNKRRAEKLFQDINKKHEGEFNKMNYIPRNTLPCD